ncbi:phospholipid phosphatase-related protein type 1 isoform X2 [Rissa tridactyla]|uniref:phospholipid phosphatase-related protein type 1 isoform X2 n=1 Tax=Rissa tridactyla TaxID=75485 RepID=UPI0023BA6534|nr:phospholipid phosphatase-related protein type 1 isoform X2 [Rissa tridactyla]
MVLLEQAEEQHCSLRFHCGSGRESGCPLKASQFTAIYGCPNRTLCCLEMRRDVAHLLLPRSSRVRRVFAFGLFATDIFVNAGQVVTGNLAPYFLTVCKPNYTGNDCRAHHQFINNGNICTGDVEVIEKARRSFPSKHAALSIYSALYATMYITSTIKTKSSRLAKPVLCLGTLCAAFLTGLNRVSEYRNHCSDVIAGFILGSAVALFLGICVVHNFKGTHGAPSKPKPEDPRGMPLMAFPRVESPLETLSAQNHSASMTEVT